MIFKEDFSPAIYTQISKVWAETKVGNPARGDTYEVVLNTLSQNGKILTVWEDTLIIGTCWLTSDNRRLYLHHMAVLPTYQNHKVGQLLIKSSIEYAKKLKLQLKLEVNLQNNQAIHLYKKFGFEFIENYCPMIKRDI